MITSLTGTIVYCMVDQPRECYDKQKGHEWKCGIVLTDEDIVDQFDEQYPKQSAKKVKASEFEELYKCELPEDAGKNVWVVTLRKNTKLSNGEPVPDKYQPRVFEQQGGSRVDITLTKLVGNGSKGTISIDHWAGEKGNVARLKNILVTDLVEYIKPEGSNYNPGDEFGDAPVSKTETVDEFAGSKGKTTAKSTKQVKAPAKPLDPSDPF